MAPAWLVAALAEGDVDAVEAPPPSDVVRRPCSGGGVQQLQLGTLPSPLGCGDLEGGMGGRARSWSGDTAVAQGVGVRRKSLDAVSIGGSTVDGGDDDDDDLERGSRLGWESGGEGRGAGEDDGWKGKDMI